MTLAYWQGPNGSRNDPTSGKFSSATNWSTGVVPGAATNVFLAPGGYTLNIDERNAQLGSAFISAGATLDVHNGDPSNPQDVYINDDSINYGTIDIYARGYVHLASGSTLFNYGLIHTDRSGAGDLADGTLVNYGIVRTDPGSFALYLASDVQNKEDGEMIAVSGELRLSGLVQNDGLIAARAGHTVLFGFNGSGRSSNLVDGTLEGGHWEVTGNGSSIRLTGAATIVALVGADVTLDGDGAFFGTRVGNAGLASIESSLRTIDKSSALHLEGGRSFAAANGVELDGGVSISGGTFSSQQFEISQSGSFAGSGTIAGDRLTVAGSIVVAGDGITITDRDTVISGSITGRGTVTLAGVKTTLSSDATFTATGLHLDGGALTIDRARVYNGILSIDDGTVTLNETFRLTKAAHFNDATFMNSSPHALLALAGGATLAGASMIDVAVRATGAFTVDGAADFERAVTGTAQFTIGDEATLEFGGSVSNKAVVALAGDGATLRLDAPATFAAHLTHFGAGDTVALAGVDAASRLVWRGDVDGSGGTLIIFDDDGRLALRLDDGAYARRDFHLAAGAGGEALLTYAAPAHHAASDHIAAADFWMPAVPIHLAHDMLA